MATPNHSLSAAQSAGAVIGRYSAQRVVCSQQIDALGEIQYPRLAPPPPELPPPKLLPPEPEDDEPELDEVMRGRSFVNSWVKLQDHAGVRITRLELGNQVGIEDGANCSVGQDAFEAIPNFDADLAIAG